jgi:hypothetical protein
MKVSLVVLFVVATMVGLGMFASILWILFHFANKYW